MMNLEDLNLSCIKKKQPLSEVNMKDSQQNEWRYSDCLTLINNNTNNKEANYDGFDDQYGGSKTISRKSSRQSSLMDFTQYQELQDKNKSLEYVNTNNEQKLSLLDKENAYLRNQLQYKEIQRTQSFLNQQKVYPIYTQLDMNNIRGDNSLQNIPESESEEIPINRSSFRKQKRNTVSFDLSRSEPTKFGSAGKSERRQSAQKIKMILNDEGKSSLEQSVRRLFSSSSNTTKSSIQNSGRRSSLISSINEKKYENVIPKIDSNLEKRPYQEEIAKKNKLKLSNAQINPNISLTQNNSNDITMVSFASQQNYKDKQSSFYNEDSMSKTNKSCYFEDLNHIFNAPNQNPDVKQKYYSYLLEESFIQQEKFTSKISEVINNEYQEFQSQIMINAKKQYAKLEDNIEMQQKRIETLTEQLIQQRSKSEQLSQLILLYQNQMVQMNHSNQKMFNQIQQIQNELSTIDLWFQFEFDIQPNNQNNQQYQQILEQIPNRFYAGAERIKSYVQGLQERISYMDKQISFNQDDYKLKLLMLKDKLDQCLIYQSNQYDMHFFQQNTYKNSLKSSDIKSIYDSLYETVQRTIGIVIQHKCERNEQNEKFLQYKTEQEQIMKTYEEINKEQQWAYEIKLNKLQTLIKKFKKQQSLLELEIFNKKMDKKRTIYRKLGKKLECKFMDNQKEIINNFNKSDIQQCSEDQKDKKSNQQQQKEQLNFSTGKDKQNSNYSQKNENQRQKNKNINRSLYQIVTAQHEHLESYKKTILEFLKLSEWLECCIEVDNQGNLIFDESFLTEISSQELKDWAKTYKKNMQVIIQQLIKRQVDTKIDFPFCDRIKLKQLIYSGNYNKYFSFLIQKLSNNSQITE